MDSTVGLVICPYVNPHQETRDPGIFTDFHIVIVFDSGHRVPNNSMRTAPTDSEYIQVQSQSTTGFRFSRNLLPVGTVYIQTIARSLAEAPKTSQTAVKSQSPHSHTVDETDRDADVDGLTSVHGMAIS